MGNKAGTSLSAAVARKKLFVEAYCANGGNATEAAKSAGYSVKTAGQQGFRLLKDVEIQQAVIDSRAKAFAHGMRANLLTAEEVLLDLANGVRFDPARMYDPATGSLLSVKDMPLEIRRELEGVEVQELGAPGEVLMARTHKVKFSGKTARREQAMKHFGLFEKDNSQKPQQLPPVFNIIAVEPRR